MDLTLVRKRPRASHSAFRIRSRRIRRTRLSPAPSSLHQIHKTPLSGRLVYLAERVGFEPTEGLTLRRFSRPVP